MASDEHQRRLLLERNARRSYFPHNRGPAKADLRRELADAVRNTAAQQLADEVER